MAIYGGGGGGGGNGGFALNFSGFNQFWGEAGGGGVGGAVYKVTLSNVTIDSFSVRTFSTGGTGGEGSDGFAGNHANNPTDPGEDGGYPGTSIFDMFTSSGTTNTSSIDLSSNIHAADGGNGGAQYPGNVWNGGFSYPGYYIYGVILAGTGGAGGYPRPGFGSSSSPGGHLGGGGGSWWHFRPRGRVPHSHPPERR